MKGSDTDLPCVASTPTTWSGAAPDFSGHRFVRPEAVLVKSSMSRICEMMWLMGLWGARAGEGRPRCPRAKQRRGRCNESPPTPGQRWSVSRKREVAFRLLRGEAARISRATRRAIYKLEHWRQKAEAALDGALKEHESGCSDR